MRLVHHEHHIMEKLQAPREDAGPDHHGVPDTHFGGIPEVMLEIEAARDVRWSANFAKKNARRCPVRPQPFVISFDRTNRRNH